MPSSPFWMDPFSKVFPSNGSTRPSRSAWTFPAFLTNSRRRTGSPASHLFRSLLPIYPVAPVKRMFMAARPRVRSSVWTKRIPSEWDPPHLLELGDHDVGFDPDLEYPAGGRLDETFQGGVFTQVQAQDLFSCAGL